MTFDESHYGVRRLKENNIGYVYLFFLVVVYMLSHAPEIHEEI